ncbi:MAG: hypothetical protein GY822_02685 [Deltaproteobacteria bacterium]|nr:hypothetical protein [Deltaproteobacteria bacterium]
MEKSLEPSSSKIFLIFGLLSLLVTTSFGSGCATVQAGLEASVEQTQHTVEQMDRMLDVPAPEQWLQKPQAQSDGCVVCLQLCCYSCSTNVSSVTSPVEEGLSGLADFQEGLFSMSMAF